MSPSARTILARACAVLLGLGVALILVEIAYRLARAPGLSPTTNPAYVQHDAELGWSYRPRARERHASAEFEVAIEINPQGFRGPEWPAKSNSRRRILVLGDSFAFGWGVAEEQCFSALLRKNEPEWDVLNAGVSGYGTDQELLLLRRLLPEVKPDLVVCVFCENDLWENESEIVYGKHKPYFVRERGELALRGVPVPRPWFESASDLYCALRKTMWERAFKTRREDPDREWILTCDIYRAMRRALGSIPLVTVSGEQRLADFSREEKDIHHLDLRPMFADAQSEITFPIDGHWTPLAHRNVAKALESFVRAIRW